MESLFEKMFHQNIIPKKHIVPFFRNYNFRILFQKVLYQKIIQKKNIVPFFFGTIFFQNIFWWNTFEKGFQNYSSEKKELYFFLELYFGETLLKKDSKIIVPKKKELYFFWNYILVKHF